MPPAGLLAYHMVDTHAKCAKSSDHRIGSAITGSTVTLLGDCAALCAKDPQCVAFSYRPEPAWCAKCKDVGPIALQPLVGSSHYAMGPAPPPAPSNAAGDMSRGTAAHLGNFTSRAAFYASFPAQYPSSMCAAMAHTVHTHSPLHPPVHSSSHCGQCTVCATYE